MSLVDDNPVCPIIEKEAEKIVLFLGKSKSKGSKNLIKKSFFKSYGSIEDGVNVRAT